jgi:hypothetical protein
MNYGIMQLQFTTYLFNLKIYYYEKAPYIPILSAGEAVLGAIAPRI